MKLDVIIIGGGTAGLSALREARKSTVNVALISDQLGTTCARVGCMPSKAFLHVANELSRARRLKDAGVKGTESLVADSAQVMEHVRKLRDHFVSGILESMDDLDGMQISGRARLTDANSVEVDGQRLTAEKIIIATGSRPIVPKEWEEFSEFLITTDNFFELETLPASVAVIGLGPIGLELGQAMSRLGVKVVGINQGDTIGGISDPHVHESAVRILEKDFPLWLRSEARLERSGKKIRVTAGERSEEVEKVLVSIGRRPNLDGLGLQDLNIPLDKKGIPEFDRQTMKVEGAPLFIAGDVDGDAEILHEATDDGRIAGFNASHITPRRFSRRVPLRLIFTEPAIATVGDSYEVCISKKPFIGEVDFSDQGRARLMLENQGKLRLYSDRESTRLLGAELVAPRGEHLAHLIAWAVQQRLPARQLLELPLYHPTIEEGLRTALKSFA